LSENSISDQTKILVVNAAYFVGKWMKKFPESETKECPFRISKVCAACEAGSRVQTHGSRAGYRNESLCRNQRRKKERKQANKAN
jgi:serine protease inhibitor